MVASLVVLGYSDAYVMSDHLPAILEHKPIGLEGFDGAVVEVMRQKKLLAREIALLPPGAGFLLIEFGDDDIEAAHRKADEFVAWIDTRPDKPQARVFRDPAQVRAVWKVRESGNGGTTVIPGEPSVTHEGWEDAAVHPRALGAYLRDFKKLLDRYGLKAWYYGHFREGCIHMRINFDLESVEDVRQFRRFVQEAGNLVIRYGGSVSGEHGDGQARAFLYPKMFGPVLARDFSHGFLGRKLAARKASGSIRVRRQTMDCFFFQALGRSVTLGRSGENYFYAMEFVEGGTLKSLIKQSGRLEVKLALEITTQVAARSSIMYRRKPSGDARKLRRDLGLHQAAGLAQKPPASRGV